MPRDKDERAVPPGLGTRGNGDDDLSSGSSPSAEAGDEEDEDFELSEESLSKLPPRERAVGAAALRALRENAELKAELARARREPPPEDDDEEDDDEDEALESQIKSLLEQIPDEGYEKFSPPVKNVLGGLIRELVTLRNEVDRSRSRESKESVQAEFRAFKRDNKDWKEYDSEIVGLFREFGIKPKRAEQFEKALEVAKAMRAKPKLEQELVSAKKAGAVPKLKSGTPSMIDRLRSGQRQGKPARNFTEAFSRAYGEAERQAGA